MEDRMYNVMLVTDSRTTRRQLYTLEVWKTQQIFTLAHEARTGAEALGMLEGSPVDLVITTIRIPDMDGIMLLQNIKQKEFAGAVILLIGQLDHFQVKQCLSYGAFDYIVEPVNEESFSNLLQRVGTYLDEKKKIKEQIENLTRMVMLKVNCYYPKVYISQITIHINGGLSDATKETLAMIMHTRKALDDDFYKTSLIICHSMHEIIGRVFHQNVWLHQFLVRQEMYESCIHECSGWKSVELAATQVVDTLSGRIRSLALRHIDNATIQRLGEYVVTHLDEELSLEALSVKLYISKAYLSELFKNKTGFAITEYLTLVKMEKARNIIVQKKLKTKEVASLLGYKDFTYFSRIYKKYWGITPGRVNRV